MTLPTAPKDYDRYVLEVCRIGQGHACCRYLLMGKGWECGKHGEFQALLDKRVAEKDIVARGDNCPGNVQDQTRH